MFARPSAGEKDADGIALPVGVAGEGLEETGSCVERGAGGREKQQGGHELESGKCRAGSSQSGQFSDLGAVRGRDADLQVRGFQGQAQGDGSDDREGQPESHPPESAPAGIIELPQLGDRRRGGFHARGQGHGHGEGQHHGDDRRADLHLPRRRLPAHPRGGPGRHRLRDPDGGPGGRDDLRLRGHLRLAQHPARGP